MAHLNANKIGRALVQCGFGQAGIANLTASAIANPSEVSSDAFCAWLGQYGVELTWAKEYLRALKSVADPRLFTAKILFLSADPARPLVRETALALFNLYRNTKTDVLELEEVLLLLSHMLEGSRAVLENSLQAQLKQRQGGIKPPLSRDQWCELASSFAQSRSTEALVMTAEALMRHAACRPQLSVNNKSVTPFVDLTGPVPLFRFIIPVSESPLMSIQFQLGTELTRRANAMGLPTTLLVVEQQGMDRQEHHLSAAMSFRLNWDLNPPFPISNDMAFIYQSFDAMHWGVGGAADVFTGATRGPSGDYASMATQLGSCGAGGIGRTPTISDIVPSPSTWQISSHAMTVDRHTGANVRSDIISGALARASTDGSTEFLARIHQCKTSTKESALVKRILALLDEFAYNGFDYGVAGGQLGPDLAELLIAISDRAAALFAREPRCVRVAAPAYVMGDLHGNFEDLKVFEKAFWRQGPNMSPANLVFLGDYVDRRNFSVEVVMYLFAQKLAAPGKITLLRGNHEMASMNQTHGFKEECLQKFGSDGQRVWERVNNAFDHLPITAVVGNTIFCVHGGIPNAEDAGAGVVERINTIPCPLRNPDIVPLARDLLWSDPQPVDVGVDYAHNAERGISHLFSTNALRTFLRNNGFQFILRAHQYKIELGFQIQKSAQLITVFSSSRYSGLENEAACLLVSDGKVRTIRVSSAAESM